MSCEAAVESCLLCPEMYASVAATCAQIETRPGSGQIGKVKCPQLSGEELEQAKENRDKAQDSKKDLEDDLKDLNEKLIDKQGELADLKTAHKEGLAEIKVKHEQAQLDLKAAMKKRGAEIDAVTQKQLQEADKILSKSLKIQHEFENAISDINRKLQEGEMKLYLHCQSQARKRLSGYRGRRRRAIRSGAYKKTALSLLSRNRVSFAKKDQVRYELYHRQCVADTKHQKDKLHADHREALKRVRQKKREYQKELERVKKTVAGLNRQNHGAKNKALAEYTETMETLIRRTDEKYGQRMEKTHAESQKLSQAIGSLKRQIMAKQARIAEQQQSEMDNAEAYHRLRNKGSSPKAARTAAPFPKR